MTDHVPVWLVERTYSDDEQNVLILKYATADGSRVFRMERALTSLSDAEASISRHQDVSPDDLMAVNDSETREWYRTEVARVRDETGTEA